MTGPEPVAETGATSGRIWRGVWHDPSDDTIVVRHRYGSCYDVIDLDPAGAHVGAELSSLPATAVPLVAAPDSELVHLRTQVAAVRALADGLRGDYDDNGRAIADKILEALDGPSEPEPDDDHASDGRCKYPRSYQANGCTRGAS